jgi:4'-phosphopantetheinyl transferase
MRSSDDCDKLWRVPQIDIFQVEDEVHVWRAKLDQPSLRIRSLLDTLAPEERKRARQFHFPKDRDNFVVARGLLRTILGRYLHLEPHQLGFRYSFYGKPFLVEEYNRSDLRFNLSHSHGLVLFAITRGRELGIDLEYIRPNLAEEEIAERFFSTYEVAILRALPAHLQAEAFFNCWTRKEAYIKAKGEGLSLPLDKFDVSLAPGEPAALLRIRGDVEDLSRWTMVELAPGVGYIGALVVERCDWRLRCWEWRQ